jgi:hypothetical protein
LISEETLYFPTNLSQASRHRVCGARWCNEISNLSDTMTRSAWMTTYQSIVDATDNPYANLPALLHRRGLTQSALADRVK